MGGLNAQTELPDAINLDNLPYLCASAKQFTTSVAKTSLTLLAIQVLPDAVKRHAHMASPTLNSSIATSATRARTRNSSARRSGCGRGMLQTCVRPTSRGYGTRRNRRALASNGFGTMVSEGGTTRSALADRLVRDTGITEEQARELIACSWHRLVVARTRSANNAEGCRRLVLQGISAPLRVDGLPLLLFGRNLDKARLRAGPTSRLSFFAQPLPPGNNPAFQVNEGCLSPL